MATRSGWTRFGVFGALLVLVASLVATPAGAQDADEERVAVIGLELLRTEQGAAAVPIRVTVESRRAIEAVLEVRAPNLNVTWQFPLALAANTEIQQLIAVPVIDGQLGRIDVTLFSGGDELADARLENLAANENAVGVLGIEAIVEEVGLRPDIGTASIIELDDLRLLRALDSIVVSPAAMRVLSPEEQKELASWIYSGHQLLVADDPGTIDDWLPESAEANERTQLLGAGVVRYVGRDWQNSVAPGISVATTGWDEFGIPLGNNEELVADGGFGVPGIGLLALVLLGYLVIAGPVMFAVLNNRKQLTKAWVVLPALAVLFTGAIFAGGKILNSGRSDAYASIVEVNPYGANVTETFLVSRSGRRTVELPETYSLIGTGVGRGFNGPNAGVPITVRPSRTTSDLEFEIDQGSGGTAIVEGLDLSVADVLVIDDVRIDGSELTGSIRNNSQSELQATTVFVGLRLVEVGSLALGESKSFTLDLSIGPQRPNQELRNWNVEVVRDFFDGPFGGADTTPEIESGPVSGTGWREWRDSKDGAAIPDGIVTAVGWSRDLDSLRGGNGRTGLVARAQLPNSDAALSPAQLRSFVFQAPSTPGFNGFDFAIDEFGAGPVEVAQFIRPSGGDTSELALSLENQVSDLALWVDGEWRSFDIDDRTGRKVAIPDEAWVDDALTAKYVSSNFGQPGARFAEVVASDNATEAIEFLPPGETADRRVDDFGPDFGPGFGAGGLGQETFIENTLVDPVPGEAQTFEFGADGFFDGTYDAWFVEVQEGDELDIRMNGFGAVDSVLTLVSPDGRQVARNDDEGGQIDSRIRWTATESGEFIIETSTLNEPFGEYELLLTIVRPAAEGGS